MARSGNDAAGVAEDGSAGLEGRGGWCPSAREPGVEQLPGRWNVIPHGDRRDRAQSRRIEDEGQSFTPWDDDVMGVFVLGDDLADCARRILRSKPLEDGAQRAKAAQGDTKTAEIAVLDCTGGRYLDRTGRHGGNRLTEEARRELCEAVITIALRALENPADVRVEPGLAPVIPGGFLGALRLALAGGLEQNRGRRGIVVRVVASRKGIVPLWPASAGVLVHKGSTHRNSISRQEWDRKRVEGCG